MTSFIIKFANNESTIISLDLSLLASGKVSVLHLLKKILTNRRRIRAKLVVEQAQYSSCRA